MTENGGKSDEGAPQKEFDPKRDAAAVKKLEGWVLNPETDPVLSAIREADPRKLPQERRHRRQRDERVPRV